MHAKPNIPRKCCVLKSVIRILLRPPRGFGVQGDKGNFFRGIGEQMPNNKGNTGNIGEQGT